MTQTDLTERLKEALADYRSSLFREMAQQEEYSVAIKEHRMRFGKVCKKLKKDKDLLFQLDETYGKRESLVERWVYRRGMADCLSLLRFLEELEAAPENNTKLEKTI